MFMRLNQGDRRGMTLICLHSKVIELSDPARLLSHDIVTGRFAARPTAIIRGEALHAQNPTDIAIKLAPRIKAMMGGAPSLRSYFMAAADAGGAVTVESVMEWHAARLQMMISKNGQPIPSIVIDRDIATVCAPDADYRIDNLLRGHGIEYKVPLHDDSISDAARYQVLCHELAHAADADEPQADHAAAVMTARAFGTTICNTMMTDIRAVIAVNAALAAVEMEPGRHRLAHDEIDEYGWRMIRAGEHAAATDTDIVFDTTKPRVFNESLDDDKEHLLSLARILNNCALAACERPMASTDSHKLKQECASQPPTLQTMAARYATATARLERGFDAYRVPGA